MADKIYCGKGKKSQYGIRMRICLDDIPHEHISTFKDKRYVTLNINELRQVDQKGNTHTISVDTWKPDGDRQDHNRAQQIHNEQKANGYQPQDDFPF